MYDHDNFYSHEAQNNFHSTDPNQLYSNDNNIYEARQHMFGLENLESVKDKQKTDDGLVTINNPASFGKSLENEKVEVKDVDYFHKYEKAVQAGFLLSLACWVFYTGVNTAMVNQWTEKLKIVDNTFVVSQVSFFLMVICCCQHIGMHLIKAQSISRIGSKSTIVISFAVCTLSNLQIQVYYMNITPYKLQILGFQCIFVGLNVIERSKELQETQKLQITDNINTWSSRNQFNHNKENEENTKRPKIPRLNLELHNNQHRNIRENKKNAKDELITDFFPTSNNLHTPTGNNLQKSFENNDIYFKDSKSATYSAITQVQDKAQDHIMDNQNIQDLLTHLGYIYNKNSSFIQQKTSTGREIIVIPLHKAKNFMNPLATKNVYDSNNHNSNTDRANDYNVPEFGHEGRSQNDRSALKTKSSTESIGQQIEEMRKTFIENHENANENQQIDAYKSFSLNNEQEDPLGWDTINKTDTINFVLKTGSPEKSHKKKYNINNKFSKSPNSFTHNTKKDHEVPFNYSHTNTEFNQTANNIRDYEVSVLPPDENIIDPRGVNFKKNGDKRVVTVGNEEVVENQDGAETPKLAILERIEGEISNLIGFLNDRRDSENKSRDGNTSLDITAPKNNILKNIVTPENRSTISDFNVVLDNKKRINTKGNTSSENSQKNNQNTSKKYHELLSNIKNISKTFLNANPQRLNTTHSDPLRQQNNDHNTARRKFS